MKRCLAVTVSAVCCLLPLRGQGTPPEIAEAVRGLRAGSYQARRQARHALSAAGWDARETLTEAARDPDPEVAVVARGLLAEMLPGVTAATPARQRQLVVQCMATDDRDERLSCLCELARMEPVAAKPLLGLLEHTGDRELMLDAIKEVGWDELLRPTLATGDVESYRLLLDLGVRVELVQAIPLATASAYHAGRLDGLRQRVAAQVAARPSPFLWRLLAEAHLLAGDGEQAVAAARRTDDWPYVEDFLARACDWQGLARELAARTPNPTGLDLLKLAAARRLAGQQEPALAAFRSIMTYDERGIGVPLHEVAGQAGTAVSLSWQGPNRQFRLDGERIGERFVFGPEAEGNRPQASACLCLLALGRVGDAIQAMVDEGQFGWACAELRDGERYQQTDELWRLALAAEPPAKRWPMAFQEACRHYELGDDAACEEVRETLAQWREWSDSEHLDRVVACLRAAGLDDLLEELLPGVLVRLEAQGDRKRIHAVLGDCGVYWRVTEFWWDRLAAARPDQPPMDRFRHLRDFLNRRLDDDETQAILDLAPPPEGNAARRAEQWLTLARTAARLRRQSDAESAYGEALRVAGEAEVGDAALEVFAPFGCWAKLARIEPSRGWMWEFEPDMTKALYLVLAGDREGARRLVERALPMLAERDASCWRLRGPAWDASGLVPRLLPLVAAAPGMVEDHHLRITRQTKDSKTALRLAQRAWYAAVCSLGREDQDADQFWNASLCFAECRAAIAAGRIAEGLAMGMRACSAFPGFVDDMAATIVALDDANATAEADQLAAHAFALRRAILEHWPNAPEHLNALAWLSAVTGRELDAGEACIRRAVRRSPDKWGYHDTLVVLLRRKGAGTEALAEVRKWLQEHPTDLGYQYRLHCWQDEEQRREGR